MLMSLCDHLLMKMKIVGISFVFLIVPVSSLLIHHAGYTYREGIRYELIKIINDGNETLNNITILLDGREYTTIPILPPNLRIKEELHLPPGTYQLEVISGNLRDNITIFVPREEIETVAERVPEKPKKPFNLIYLLVLAVIGIIYLYLKKLKK